MRSTALGSVAVTATSWVGSSGVPWLCHPGGVPLARLAHCPSDQPMQATHYTPSDLGYLNGEDQLPQLRPKARIEQGVGLVGNQVAHVRERHVPWACHSEASALPA